ncbi:SHOCT domain-containing protein [Thalassotalea fusca]
MFKNLCYSPLNYLFEAKSNTRISILNLVIVLLVISACVGAISPAVADDYRINQLATIERAVNASPLQSVINNPFNSNQLITAYQNGEIALFDIDNKHSKTLIAQESDESSLVSLAIHPNFTQKNEFGYAILYSSHIEPKKRRGRTFIQATDAENTDEDATELDAVIYEWQFSVSTNLTPMSARKREVFRVGIDDSSNGITNIRFNPYVKPWQDTYGLMYVSVNRAYLSTDDETTSNAILRFRPEKFGLKNYSLVNNGIALNDETHAAILIGNLGRISYFSWNKQNEEHLQIAIDTPPTIVLVEVPYGQLAPDLTQVRPLFQLKSTDVAQAFYTYHEKAISQLRHHLLYLVKRSGAWELTALNAGQQTGSVFLWQLPLDILSPNGKYSLLSSVDGQLMLLDHETLYLFGISSTNNGNPQVAQTAAEKSSEEESNGLIWLVLLVPVLISILLYWQHKNKMEARKLLRRKYARFTFSEQDKFVHLYKRHAVDIDTTIAINAIAECLVILNDKEILTISSKDDCGFDAKKETNLDKLFIEEKRRKMVGDEVRKVEVIFIDNDTRYECCIYLREGNQRYTKAKFAEVCGYLIDWCWFYSEQINPTATGKRIVKSKPEAKTKLVKTTTPPAQANANSNPSSTTQAQPTSLQQPKPVGIEAMRGEKITKVASSSPHVETTLAHETSPVQSNDRRTDPMLDSQIIESLDKLSKLKQQGHLTEEEFNQAKAKLLRDLTGM